MKLDTILLKNDVTLSFEVFPPKVTANYESVKEAAYGVAKRKPSYMSRREYRRQNIKTSQGNTGGIRCHNDCASNLCRRDERGNPSGAHADEGGGHRECAGTARRQTKGF